MLTTGIFSFFAWMIVSFIIVIDIFKKKTALGCLGLILLPIIPLIWVFKGYSGNKKIMGSLLYGSALFAITGIGVTWASASADLKTFIESAKKEGLELHLTSINSRGGEMSYVVAYRGIYVPEEAFASVDEMLALIQKEKANTLAAHYPEALTDEIVVLAIPTESGFIAMYEIDAINSIRKSYISGLDDF